MKTESKKEMLRSAERARIRKLIQEHYSDRRNGLDKGPSTKEIELEQKRLYKLVGPILRRMATMRKKIDEDENAVKQTLGVGKYGRVHIDDESDVYDYAVKLLKEKDTTEAEKKKVDAEERFVLASLETATTVDRARELLKQSGIL